MRDLVKTVCPYCGVGCGLDISRDATGAVQVRGDKTHPANFGRLCSKGSALAETIDLDGRLLQPLVHGRESTWDQALDTVAQRFRVVIDEHGPDAVAFYVSGQLLTEDYYVANKLMKGFIGSGNIDTNSRLCMSSSVAGHKRAFGSDTVPGCYEDLERADLIVLAGSNTAWCHPVIYQRIYKAKQDRPELKVVVIDPRRTATCDVADLHLALQPGTDVSLFNGLLSWLSDHDCVADGFVDRHTVGAREALQVARWYAPSTRAVADHCGVSVDALEQFYRWFATTERTVTVYSQGINQSSSGSDKVNAIVNCHLLTGRIGREGMGPLSLTGQPNAMGGREVGGLANQLAAHMDLENAEQRRLVADFWQTPNIATRPGSKAVDMFEAVERGEIKALWVMATNPSVSAPDANRVRRALENCEFLVVSDCIANTDTTAHADVLLPAAAWGEKSGTVTNSERRISRQRAFLSTPGEARPDWWIVAQLAQRLGYPGFGYRSSYEVFREHAALSALDNGGRRDFDLTGLKDLTEREFDQLAPVQWPLPTPGLMHGQPRMFGDGRFYTTSGKAQFVAATPRPPGAATSDAFPLILNTGRIRDQWHTMTRTGKAPRLNGHVSEPFVAINPLDAEALGIEQGDLAQVASAWGQVIVRGQVSDTQQPGQVFVPIHWNDQFASAGRIDAVVNPILDPISGQPEFKHTPVSVTPFSTTWYGFVLSREPIDTAQSIYWVKTRRSGLWHYELAGVSCNTDWSGYARQMLHANPVASDWTELYDSAQQRYRGACFDGERLQACIFISPDRSLPPREWLMELFGREQLDSRQRMRVLAGTPGPGQEDAGRTVCSCFGVGYNTLCRAINDQGLDSVTAIGEQLSAGTNCGSCIPELRAMLAEQAAVG